MIDEEVDLLIYSVLFGHFSFDFLWDFIFPLFSLLLLDFMFSFCFCEPLIFLKSSNFLLFFLIFTFLHFPFIRFFLIFRVRWWWTSWWFTIIVIFLLDLLNGALLSSFEIFVELVASVVFLDTCHSLHELGLVVRFVEDLLFYFLKW